MRLTRQPTTSWLGLATSAAFSTNKARPSPATPERSAPTLMTSLPNASVSNCTSSPPPPPRPAASRRRVLPPLCTSCRVARASSRSRGSPPALLPGKRPPAPAASTARPLRCTRLRPPSVWRVRAVRPVRTVCSPSGTPPAAYTPHSPMRPPPLHSLFPSALPLRLSLLHP